MTQSTFFVPNRDGWNTMIIGPSGEPRSLLHNLTQQESAEMTAWSDQQPRGPGGAIELMGWPGWKAVLERQFKERFGVDLKESAGHALNTRTR